MFDNWLTHLRTQTVQDVQKACRKARLMGQFTEAMGGQGRDFRRLGDDGVPHQQGWRHLPRQQIERKVPR